MLFLAVCYAKLENRRGTSSCANGSQKRFSFPSALKMGAGRFC